MEKEKQIIAKIYSSYKSDGGLEEKETTEILGVIRMQPDVPYVTISTDRKFSEKYATRAASVFCSVPCVLNEEEMDKAYAFAAKFCETKLAEMMP